MRTSSPGRFASPSGRCSRARRKRGSRGCSTLAVSVFLALVPSSSWSVETDIHWIVYIGTRGWKDSGSSVPVGGSEGTRDLPASRVPGGPDPGEREAAGAEVDLAPPERHGVPEAQPVRPAPPE